jgi:hypothetical protein
LCSPRVLMKMEIAPYSEIFGMFGLNVSGAGEKSRRDWWRCGERKGSHGGTGNTAVFGRG